MATPGELVRTVASAFDVSEVSVSVYYRNLREAGLLTKGGRGRSAPSLTCLDASRLVIALMVSDSATHAAREVRKYGRLPLTHMDEPAPNQLYPGFSSELFSKLNFESAVGYVLEIVSGPGSQNLVNDEMYPLVISGRSDVTAEIYFSLHGYYDAFPPDWIESETGVRVSPSRQFHSERMPQGLRVQRDVGGTALVRVAACLKS